MLESFPVTTTIFPLDWIKHTNRLTLLKSFPVTTMGVLLTTDLAEVIPRDDNGRPPHNVLLDPVGPDADAFRIIADVH